MFCTQVLIKENQFTKLMKYDKFAKHTTGVYLFHVSYYPNNVYSQIETETSQILFVCIFEKEYEGEKIHIT